MSDDTAATDPSPATLDWTPEQWAACDWLVEADTDRHHCRFQWLRRHGHPDPATGRRQPPRTAAELAAMCTAAVPWLVRHHRDLRDSGAPGGSRASPCRCRQAVRGLFLMAREFLTPWPDVPPDAAAESVVEGTAAMQELARRLTGPPPAADPGDEDGFVPFRATTEVILPMDQLRPYVQSLFRGVMEPAGGRPPAGRPKEKRKTRVPHADAERRVADYLARWERDNPRGDPHTVTVRKIESATGVSTGSCSELECWQKFQADRNRSRPKGGRRPVPLPGDPADRTNGPDAALDFEAMIELAGRCNHISEHALDWIRQTSAEARQAIEAADPERQRVLMVQLVSQAEDAGRR